jgi:hypothetical protein
MRAIQWFAAFLVASCLLMGNAQSQPQSELPPEKLKTQTEAISTATGISLLVLYAGKETSYSFPMRSIKENVFIPIATFRVDNSNSAMSLLAHAETAELRMTAIQIVSLAVRERANGHLANAYLLYRTAMLFPIRH